MLDLPQQHLKNLVCKAGLAVICHLARTVLWASFEHSLNMGEMGSEYQLRLASCGKLGLLGQQLKQRGPYP